ncbi:MAG: DUF2203 family protein, partial [candidate division WOR-3 bacterium]
VLYQDMVKITKAIRDIGLVDFPGLIEGREVYLCWKSDEEDIQFYHGVEEGFAGRKPIPKEYYEPE